MTTASLESRARREARKRYESPGFRGAFVRGALAADRGHSADSCPYRRLSRGARGWRAWRSAWLAGYAWGSG